MPERKKKKNVNQIPKPIILIAKGLQSISTDWATRFAYKLFTTPIRYKMPKREFHMDQNSKQNQLLIPAIGKSITVYHYGTSPKKVLLVHGWSGRGTQLVKIADELLKNNYTTISFDAPAHGKSKGNFSVMTEFIASILELEKQYGPFEFVIGHSLGGMSVLNAIKQKLQTKKAIVIGSGDIIKDIIDDFIQTLQLKPLIGNRLQEHFEQKFKQPMNNYSAYIAAQNIHIPILIIHDKDDSDVNVKAAYHIHKHLSDSELMITEKLGHRKILGDKNVIANIINFISR